MGDNEDMAMDATEVHGAVVKEKILKIGLIIKTEEPAVASHKKIFSIIEVEVKTIHFKGDKDSGMETTPIIMTEITG